MLSIFRGITIFLFFVSFGFTALYGQVAKSPISSFGIGELYGDALVNSQGMGGVGVSNPQFYYLNNQNPALLVFNAVTTMSAGFLMESRTTTNGSLSEQSTNGNLGYLNLGFPVIRSKWSAGLGLAPYSNVNYKLQYQSSLEGTAEALTVTEEGNGGINQVYWSNGININRYVSVGAKASYLFGSIVDQFSNQLSATSFYPNLYERYHFSDFKLSTGISLRADSIFNKYRVALGGVYEFQTNVNTDYTARIERKSGGIILDSLTVQNESGVTILPPSVLGGISFGNNQWTLAADVSFLQFSKFRDYSGNRIAKDVWNYAIGGEFVPNASSADSYLLRMGYRAGVSVSNSPYFVNGHTVRDFGINFGLALPVSGLSSIDLALKVGKRGTIRENSIAENYFKIYFGMTFNDRWFIKSVFN